MDDNKLGPTGRFPAGKLNEHDEGELNMGIKANVTEGIVEVHFGKPIGWFGLGPAEARQFAALLIANAEKIEKRVI